MRLALIGRGDEMDRVAAWLADEGLIVRRFDDAAALAAHDRNERFDWVIWRADDSAANSDIMDGGRQPGTRRLAIADALPAGETPGLTVMTRPLRRRLLLQVVRDAPAAQERETK